MKNLWWGVGQVGRVQRGVFDAAAGPECARKP